MGRVDKQAGERLRRLREASKLRQQDVASTLNTTISTVSRMESGQRTLQLPELIPIARLLRVPTVALVDYLLNDEGPIAVQLHNTEHVVALLNAALECLNDEQVHHSCN